MAPRAHRVVAPPTTQGTPPLYHVKRGTAQQGARERVRALTQRATQQNHFLRGQGGGHLGQRGG